MTFVPRALIAEVTHRCPLRCVYCSNPLEMRSRSGELSTTEWQRVFGEAAALGVLQLHLTGGEPLARPDTEQLVKAGRAAGLYVNLITSGIGLAEARLERRVWITSSSASRMPSKRKRTRSPAHARMPPSWSSPSASGNIASLSP